MNMPLETDATFNPLAGRKWLVLALILIAIYGLAMDARWHVGRDSSFYLGLGRSIAQGEGMTFNGDSHAWANPALPLLWAGIIRVFGESYLAGRAVMAAMALATILAGYRLARDLRGPALAACVLIVLAGNGRLLANSQVMQTDLPFCCMVTVSLLCVRRFLAGGRWWIAAAGAAMGVAFLFRLVGVVLLPLMLLGIVLDGSAQCSRMRRLRGAVAMVLAAMPFLLGWFLYYRATQGHGQGAGYMATAQDRYLGGGLGELVQIIWHNLSVELPRHMTGLLIGQRLILAASVPFCLVLLVGVAVSARRREAFLLLPALGYAGFLMTWATTSIDARYLMPILPVAAIWLIDGAMAIFGWIGRRRASLAAKVPPVLSVFIVACVVGAVSLAPTVYKRVRWLAPDCPWQVESAQEQRLCGVTQWLARHTAPGDKVMVREEHIVHYWTGRPTLFVPSFPPGEPTPEYRRGLAPLVECADWIVLLPGNDDRREVALTDYIRHAPDKVRKVDQQFGYEIYRTVK